MLPSNTLEMMKSKTISLDNRVSRPTLLLLPSDHSNLIWKHFQVSYNDDMYEEINLDLFEDMHSVSTKAEAKFDEYVDMSFQDKLETHQELPDHFHQYMLHPSHLKNMKHLLLLDGIQVVTQLGDGVIW